MPDVPADAFARIQLLLLDVDGVLTDGRIVYTDAGDELKAFHVRDGSALKLWRQSGRRVAILSGRSSPTVTRRAAELGIDPVVQGADEKLPALTRILTDAGLRPDQVCAVGDDLPDLPVLRHCGLAATVADAVPEVKAIAHFVTTAPGGQGAVREVVEWLMRGQGTWDSVVNGLAATGSR
jgi:3-deoxy-D-manno-octulosonate 8-phosphate phosphatase (KDO 8-P phosphatase)